MRFLTAVALASVMLWVPVDGVSAQPITNSRLLDNILVELAEAGLLDQRQNYNPSAARIICNMGSGSVCYSVNTIGQAICSAVVTRNPLLCYGDKNMAEGICLAGSHNVPTRLLMCGTIGYNIGQAICLASPHEAYGCTLYVNTIDQGVAAARRSHPQAANVDREWAWDEINAPYGRGRMWRCRGIQTGRFAEDYRCAGLPRIDYRWPGEDR